MIKANTKAALVKYLFLILLLFGTCVTVHAQTQPNLRPLYYTGLVGGDEPYGRRILLRWFTLEQFIPLDSALIYRTGADNVREHIATVRKSRSASVIKSVFFRPGEERILDDAREILERIYGTSGQTQDDFAQLVVDLLEGKDVSEYATTRRNFLMQTNYGFSIVEGYGYLDFVDEANGPYVYELWQGDASGNPLEVLGKITLDPTQQTILPAPANLEEIFLNGRDGVTPARANHRRIFLDWEVPPDLFDKRDINFGFDIYRLDRALNQGEDYNSVKHLLHRVNDMPIMPPSPIPDEEESQSYTFADDGDWLETLNEEDLLPVGQTYTYWAVARDLLGNDGLPSNPLEAIVRDTFEPDFPRGLNIVPSQTDDGVPFLRIFWNRQDVDTVAYRLYRYQSYTNQGKIGPFADIDGLTEGFITEIDQPAINVERPSYDDFEPGTTDFGRVFWYCIAAVDAYGNISALSPPARAVIDDVIPPTLDGILEICGSRPVLFLDGSVQLDATGREPNWRPLFEIEKLNSYYTLLRITRTRPVSGPQGRPTVIAEISLTSGGNQFFEEGPDDTVTNFDDIPLYEFEAVAFDGRTVSTTVSAPSWSSGDPRARYKIQLSSRGDEEFCLPVAIANDPVQVGVIPGGDVPPVKLKAACPGDAETMRLYRSVDGGKNYTFIREFGCGGVDVDLVDDFHPEGLVQVKYSIAPVDENGNIGIPHRVPAEFLYLGNVPRPTLTDVRASGNDIPSQRRIIVKWVGPEQGISHYTVIIRPTPKPGFLASPTIPHEFALSDVNTQGAPGDFSYDPGTGEYSVSVTEINRDGDELQPDVEYTVQVAAVPKAGQPAYSTNQMPLLWSADSLLFGGGAPGVLRWAARPLPEVDPGDELILKQSTSIRGGSVLIPVRFESTEFPAEDLIAPPLMVWRRRADIPNQPWSAVSPVLEEIRRTNGQVDDPFFAKDVLTVYFVDNSGHVPFRKYEYIVLDLNPNTFEIDRAIGPLEVEVEIDPQ